MSKIKHYRYRNHDVHTVNGYPAIYTNEKCTVYIHRLVAEEMLGRELKPGEIVHHDDGDRSNYDEENIMVFKTNSDHVRYHNCGVALLTEDGTYICDQKIRALTKPELKFDDSHLTECPECGRPKDRNAKLCEKCRAEYNSRFIQGTDRLKPTKEELLEDLNAESLNAIARKYGVSASSVKKWINKYGLRNE